MRMQKLAFGVFLLQYGTKNRPAALPGQKWMENRPQICYTEPGRPKQTEGRRDRRLRGKGDRDGF